MGLIWLLAPFAGLAVLLVMDRVERRMTSAIARAPRRPGARRLPSDAYPAPGTPAASGPADGAVHDATQTAIGDLPLVLEDERTGPWLRRGLRTRSGTELRQRMHNARRMSHPSMIRARTHRQRIK